MAQKSRFSMSRCCSKPAVLIASTRSWWRPRRKMCNTPLMERAGMTRKNSSRCWQSKCLMQKNVRARRFYSGYIAGLRFRTGPGSCDSGGGCFAAEAAARVRTHHARNRLRYGNDGPGATAPAGRDRLHRNRQPLSTGKTFHRYINPERDMPAAAFAVHGLSAEFLSTTSPFAEVVEDFLEFVGDAPLDRAQRVVRPRLHQC